MNVSYIIGSGIFVGPAFTLQLVGSGGMNLIIWAIGAFVAFSGTYTFMELGTMVSIVYAVYNIYYLIIKTTIKNSYLEGNDDLHTCIRDRRFKQPLLLFSGGEVGYLEYCYRRPKYLLAYLFTYWSLMNRSSGVASQGIQNKYSCKGSLVIIQKVYFCSFKALCLEVT